MNDGDCLPGEISKELRTASRRDLLDEFQRDHPDYDRNVVVLMTCDDSTAVKSLWKCIQEHLASRQLIALRADMKTYGESRQSLDNLITYMCGCKFGIAVLEDYSSNEFNPNAALGYGFMRALGKHVLLLKEKHFRNIRAELLRTVWIEFDMLNIGATIGQALDGWLKAIT